ncbi:MULTISPECIES: WXG100 family type VII secretion target [Bacillus]|uniref:WXG100 family type VII secretion target n=1 Tax=Bacillus TaxID=1386 RepID=UPI000D838047|nr:MULTISPECIES: WXG100 family type VII secretion target [Bacillus]PYE92927.1 WXG100 family type VII secretion target [Bacillus sp. 196mf]
MVQIKVTPEMLEEVANRANNTRNALESIHNDLCNQIDYLCYQWIGASNQNFIQMFNDARPKAFTSINAITNVEEELKRIAEKFRNADNQDVTLEEGAMCSKIPPKSEETFWDRNKKDLNDAWTGISTGVVDGVVDAWDGFVALGDKETWLNMKDAIVNYKETLPVAWNALSDSFMNELWNGDMKSREHYAAYAVTSLLTGFIGSKGLDKVGQVGKIAAVTSLTKGKSILTTAPAYRDALYTLNNFKLNTGNRFAYAGVGGNSLKTSLVDTYQTAKDKLSPYQYTKSNTDGDTFVGKLYGKDVHLDDVKVADITYSKRTREEAEQLRKEFDRSVRKDFLNALVNDPVKLEELKKAGITDADIERMKRGNNPKGWQVHHNLPLDDGGTNTFENLTLIQNHPYHKVITNTQRTLTKGLQPGDSVDISWPIPKYNIYPKGE